MIPQLNEGFHLALLFTARRVRVSCHGQGRDGNRRRFLHQNLGRVGNLPDPSVIRFGNECGNVRRSFDPAMNVSASP